MSCNGSSESLFHSFPLFSALRRTYILDHRLRATDLLFGLSRVTWACESGHIVVCVLHALRTSTAIGRRPFGSPTSLPASSRSAIRRPLGRPFTLKGPDRISHPLPAPQRVYARVRLYTRRVCRTRARSMLDPSCRLHRHPSRRRPSPHPHPHPHRLADAPCQGPWPQRRPPRAAARRGAAQGAVPSRGHCAPRAP